MRSFFEPAVGAPWLKQVLSSIRGALSDVWDFPIRLWRVATADLPTASTENEGGIAYDITTSRLIYSDGSVWTGVMPYNAGAALTRTNDTNVTLTLGGSPSTALLNATSLTLGWTGSLAPDRGGTGIASYTTGDILFASGATTLAKLADVATGNALISGGVGTAPSWGKIGISTHISGLGTGVATALAVNTGSAGAVVLFNGALGTPSSGTLTNCTFPTLNQNTTGSAATLTTTRTIWGQNFNGSANVSGAITGAAAITSTVADAAFSLSTQATTGNFRIYPYYDATNGVRLWAFAAGFAGEQPFTCGASSFRWEIGSSLKLTLSSSALNMASGVALQANGTQVVTARQTGWGAATGTATRTAIATYTAPTISSPPTQAEVQAIADALQAWSRRTKALTDDLATHGLIGA